MYTNKLTSDTRCRQKNFKTSLKINQAPPKWSLLLWCLKLLRWFNNRGFCLLKELKKVDNLWTGWNLIRNVRVKVFYIKIVMNHGILTCQAFCHFHAGWWWRPTEEQWLWIRSPDPARIPGDTKLCLDTRRKKGYNSPRFSFKFIKPRNLFFIRFQLFSIAKTKTSNC